jgi:hypothetical protein
MLKRWTGGDGDWGVDANWEPPGVPDRLDNIIVGPASVTNRGEVLISRSLTIQNDATLDNQGTVGIDDERASLVVGETGTFLNQDGATLDCRRGQFLNGGTCTNAGTLTNHGPSVMMNSGTLNNEGAGRFVNQGTIGNSGTLHNAARGALTNSAVSLVNSGELTNEGSLRNRPGARIENTGGTLSNQENGSFENGGALVNTGVITNAAVMTTTGANRVENRGRLINHGRLTHAAGQLNTILEGLIENHASLVARARIQVGRGFPQGNPARLENMAGGTVAIDGPGVLFVFGATAVNHADAVIRVFDGGSINNLGQLVNHGTLRVEHEVFNQRNVDHVAEILNHPGGAITVTGLIENDAVVSNVGGVITAEDGGTIENNADGEIRNGDAGQLSVEPGGAVQNLGRLRNDGALLNAGGTVTNLGLLRNRPGATLIASRDGTLINEKNGVVRNRGEVMFLQQGRGDLVRELVNRGTIDNRKGGVLTGDGAELQNEGGLIVNRSRGRVVLTGDCVLINRDALLFDADAQPSPGLVANERGGHVLVAPTALLRNRPRSQVDNLGQLVIEGEVRNEAGRVINAAGGELVVNSAGQLNNQVEEVGGDDLAGVVTNDGRLADLGTIANAGRIENRRGARLDVGGGTLRNTGVVLNEHEAALTAQSAATVENDGGTFTNFGSVETGGAETRFLNRNGGRVLNQRGTVENRGRIVNERLGLLQNYGTFTNEPAGEVTNAPIGRLQNLRGGRFDNLGTVHNRGDLLNSAARFRNRGHLTNHRELINQEVAHFTNAERGVLNNAVGAFLFNRRATITNRPTGVISTGGTMSHGPHGIFVNEADGEISNRGGMALGEFCFLVNRGTLVNHARGTIRNMRGTIANRGNIVNRDAALVESDWLLDNHGEINNAASIDYNGLLRLDPDSVINNNGTIRQFCDGRVLNADRIHGNPVVDACDQNPSP